MLSNLRTVKFLKKRAFLKKSHSHSQQSSLVPFTDLTGI